MLEMPNHILISYFAGGGGASLGAIAAGITTTIGVEWDNNIADLYRANVGNCFTADVTKFDPRCLDLPTLEERKRTGDLLIWQLSPPCVEFSRANTKQNRDSKRATIIKEIFWHEEIIRPDYIVLENVIDYRKYHHYQDFCKYLQAKGYSLVDYILNAADFGVPQSRERLIMIAARKGLSLPTITKTHDKNANVGQLSLFGESKLPWVGWYDAIADLLPTLSQSRLTDKQVETVQALNCLPQTVMVERVGYRNGIPKIAFKDEPCWTIRAMLSDDGKTGTRTKIIDAIANGNVRSLNTHAIARLQSFPDDYRWSSQMSLDVRVLGNSVPPLLMQKITEAILKL